MFAKIKRLDEATINQIAAGEVVENPASVIKELIENALDARATKIEITTKAGGRQLIRISDDGSGMSEEDALLSLERHATSKISTVIDLDSLSTMGFRGEALPSIAAISHLTLTTATSESPAISISIEGGKVLSIMPALRKPGTTIEVRSLFYNVPARKKFQKSISADSAEIHKSLIAIALANLHCSFQWTHDDKPIFDLKTSSLTERVGILLEDKFEGGLISVDYEKCSFSVRGLLGSPLTHFSNRLNQYLFINKRPVLSPLISKAVREGFGPRLPNNRYPFFILHLTIPMNEVDVNVHPQKKEVRFSNERELYLLFFDAIEKALQGDSSSLNDSHSIKCDRGFFEKTAKSAITGYYKSFDEPFEMPSLKVELPEDVNLKIETPLSEASIKNAKNIFSMDLVNNQRLSEPKSLNDSYINSKISSPPSFSIDLSPPEKKTFFNPSCFALTLFEGYALVSGSELKAQDLNFDEGLYFIDLLKASRRVHYELWTAKDRASQTQQLLFPIALKLTKIEALMLESSLEDLNSLGFNIRSFGIDTYVVDAIPTFLEHEQIKAVIDDFIGELSLSKRDHLVRDPRLHLLKYVKNTIKTVEQSSLLIQKLLHCQERFYCPFGQKIFSLMTVEELRKRF